MGKLPKLGYWELRINSAIVIAIGSAILFPIFYLYLSLNNPEPAKYDRYAFYKDSDGFYHPIKLSRYVQGAEESQQYYSNQNVDKKIFGSEEQPILVPGTLVGIIKYSPDSLYVKIKAQGTRQNKYLTSGIGWVPTQMIQLSFDSSKVVNYSHPVRTTLIK